MIFISYYVISVFVPFNFSGRRLPVGTIGGSYESLEKPVFASKGRGVGTVLTPRKDVGRRVRLKPSSLIIKSSKQTGMKEADQSCDSLYSREYQKEWVRRSTYRFERMMKGGVLAKQQSRFEEIGTDLKNLRISQNRTRDDIAQEIGMKPTTLCFLETGWFEYGEFMEVVDRWTQVLGVQSDTYKRDLMHEDQDHER